MRMDSDGRLRVVTGSSDVDRLIGAVFDAMIEAEASPDMTREGFGRRQSVLSLARDEDAVASLRRWAAKV